MKLQGTKVWCFLTKLQQHDQIALCMVPVKVQKGYTSATINQVMFNQHFRFTA